MKPESENLYTFTRDEWNKLVLVLRDAGDALRENHPVQVFLAVTEAKDVLNKVAMRRT
jgi:hypothetical protein